MSQKERENFRDIRFVFELDGEQAITVLAAMGTYAEISNRPDIQEACDVLNQQYREQGGGASK